MSWADDESERGEVGRRRTGLTLRRTRGRELSILRRCSSYTDWTATRAQPARAAHPPLDEVCALVLISSVISLTPRAHLEASL